MRSHRVHPDRRITDQSKARAVKTPRVRTDQRIAILLTHHFHVAQLPIDALRNVLRLRHVVQILYGVRQLRINRNHRTG